MLYILITYIFITYITYINIKILLTNLFFFQLILIIKTTFLNIYVNVCLISFYYYFLFFYQCICCIKHLIQHITWLLPLFYYVWFKFSYSLQNIFHLSLLRFYSFFSFLFFLVSTPQTFLFLFYFTHPFSSINHP